MTESTTRSCDTPTCSMKGIAVKVAKGTTCLSCGGPLRSMADRLFGDAIQTVLDDLFGN